MPFPNGRTEYIMDYLKAFIAGGLICVVGQILIDRTKLTPAKILLSFLMIGFLLTAVGVYEPFVEWAGAGATVPLSGFGYLVAKGTEKAINENGLSGIITGGLTSAAGGIGAVILFSFFASLLSKSNDKN